MKPQWYFTADLHLGHKGILTAGYRTQYKNTEEMDAGLIEAWNDTVRPKDCVVHLGDFTLANRVIAESYKKQLQGNIIWVKGNHDHWMGGHRYEWHKRVNQQVIYGTHFPLRTWTQNNYRWNLCGHSHGTLEPLYNQLDVGVDNAFNILGAYRPFSFSEVNMIMTSRNYQKTLGKESRYYEV
jgi:calcineurin-like phosphoesterase family protein